VNVLLLSMPDSFEHMPPIAVRMPNGALSSLAGNLDPEHRVLIADLILVQQTVRATIERLVREVSPDVVGLSVMTFQRKTAARIIALLRSLKPDLRIVVGGYDPSLASNAYISMSPGPDFIIRGEGEIPFRLLLRTLDSEESSPPLAKIPGLTYRRAGAWTENPIGPVHSIESGEVRLPNRSARALTGYRFLGSPVDVIETSRGCTFDCGFCSIIEMRGRNFHTFSFDRVIADIADAKAHGARSLFIVDDNITLNIHRFEALCQAIIDADLNDLEYLVQGMTSAIVNGGERLASLMQRAGFRYVFLGIENVVEDDLQFLNASAKNRLRVLGKSQGNASIRAIELLHQHKMYVVGGLIVGNPEDTRETIHTNLKFASKYVDWPYIQHPTPYPRTPMTKDFQQRQLIVNDNVEEYDGTTAVVRTSHLPASEIEFIRWRAERWMKVKHIPSVLRHRPKFVLENWRKMLAHTFRGTTWKALLGLECDRLVFARYQQLRSRERVFL
jgi:anaerobic magnesium-protoporphyrin IX monomethyl ester cyclase